MAKATLVRPETEMEVDPIDSRSTADAGSAEQTASELIESLIRSSEPGHEEIAKLAYALWQENGCRDGCADEDWYRAEKLIRSNGGALA